MVQGASDKARPPPVFLACAKLVFVEIAILLKLIGKVSTCQWLTNCLVFSSVSFSVPVAHHPRHPPLMMSAGGVLGKRNGPRSYSWMAGPHHHVERPLRYINELHHP